MNHSYFLAGTKLNNLLRLMWHNRALLPHPRYLLRYLFLFQNGLWASFFALRERKKFKKQLGHYPLPDNPVIITGHWRTGSTLLHQLMNLDPQFSAPTLFNITLPDGFLVSEKFYRPVMSRLLKKTRPMDNVKTGFDEPEEDEYALLKYPGCSPLEKMIFQKNKQFFLSGTDNLYPSEGNKEKWLATFNSFIKKIAFSSGKRVLLKNPFHAQRISLLDKQFPNALFIHTYRDPAVVIPSTARMWNTVGRQNKLKGRWHPPSPDDLINVMNKTLTVLQKQLYALPQKKYIEVKFEDLEKNPADMIKKIYQHFNLSFSEEILRKINNFLEENRHYQKNSYTLTPEELQNIREKLQKHISHYGY